MFCPCTPSLEGSSLWFISFTPFPCSSFWPKALLCCVVSLLVLSVWTLPSWLSMTFDPVRTKLMPRSPPQPQYHKKEGGFGKQHDEQAMWYERGRVWQERDGGTFLLSCDKERWQLWCRNGQDLLMGGPCNADVGIKRKYSLVSRWPPGYAQWWSMNIAG